MILYQPQEDSHLLQKYVKKHAFGRVLDMGTGSGIQALTAIKNPNVREAIAVDVSEDLVEELKKQIENKKIRKIKVIKSDLFENVHSHFNTIIFNPPYLPEDKREEKASRLATTGGKHGWEISERFFSKVSEFLFPDGKILFLFSSLTNKDKIDEIISNNLLEFEQLEQQKQPMFEELYVYLIRKSLLLRKLEKKGIENIHYFTHGRRGDIFTGVIDKGRLVKTHFAAKKIVKVGIKVKREESKAVERIKNEAKWLKILNKQGIGPKLLFYGENHVVYVFVEGKFILDFVGASDEETIKRVLANLLQQCFTLDKLKANKEEMHHPLKHIIIRSDHKPILLDFERCHHTENPHNVTQFVEFICRMKNILNEKGINIGVDNLRELAKKYKESFSKEAFEELLHEIQ